MTNQSSARVFTAIALLSLGMAPVLAQMPKQKSTSIGQVMTMEDLKLDISGLGGQTISVVANLTVIDGETVMLTDPDIMFDFASIWGDMSDLPRPQRQMVLQQCNDFCRFTVTGRVQEVLFQEGLVITDIRP